MPLALFDIDGTLTASNAIDSLCFADAFHDVFGIEIDTNWGAEDDIIISFGDAPWDVRAAASLALPFIGIGRRSGAAEAFEDFRDSTALLSTMNRVTA